jgi:hypothetical protein
MGSAIGGGSGNLCLCMATINASPAGHRTADEVQNAVMEGGKEDQIALCQWQLRNDGGWSTTVFGVQKC